jgi:hypothetical protein
MRAAYGHVDIYCFVDAHIVARVYTCWWRSILGRTPNARVQSIRWHNHPADERLCLSLRWMAALSTKGPGVIVTGEQSICQTHACIQAHTRARTAYIQYTCATARLSLPGCASRHEHHHIEQLLTLNAASSLLSLSLNTGGFSVSHSL